MQNNKVVVIGIDGAPFELIDKWARSGDLPNISRLIERGGFGVLRSTIPVHSPTAWASFITGLNPGQHGVFDFAQREADGYELRVVRADQIPGKSLWRLLSDEKKRVAVINVPMTYPPEPVNGFLLSGLGTPDYSIYSYPPEMTAELNGAGYRVNKKFFFVPDRLDEWLQDIHEITEIRGRTTVRLLQKEPWDFAMVVFRNSDEICHFFWHHLDETHPDHDPDAPPRYKNAILDLYQHIDKWVGEIVAVAGEKTNFIVMSDHGAGPLYKDVFLNEWLIEKGWLILKETPTGRGSLENLARKTGLTRANISDKLTRMDLHRVEVVIKKLLGDRIKVLPRDERPEFTSAIDWEHTSAYSMGYYGQIFINLRGREPLGIIEPGEEYETLRDEIARQMLEIVDTEDGRKVVDRVYKKEELYHGEFLDDAPDLLAIMRNLTYITRMGYEFAAERGIFFRKPYTAESGSHRLEGILVAAGPDIARQKELPDFEIQDLTPTVLYLMGCSIPTYMDGRLIEPLVDPALLREFPKQYIDMEIESRDDAPDTWDEVSEAEVKERLKKLGYLG